VRKIGCVGPVNYKKSFAEIDSKNFGWYFLQNCRKANVLRRHATIPAQNAVEHFTLEMLARICLQILAAK
jgi:hypothetical protein